MMKENEMTDVVIAADGGPVPGACNTLGEFLASLEDGQFDQDCYQVIRDLAAKMNDHVAAHGSAVGSVTLTINFRQDEAVTEIRSAFKVKAPEEKRARSLMWNTEDNRFTRVRPNQGQLFGIRDVSGNARQMRDAV
jgi:hypothetical protein